MLLFDVRTIHVRVYLDPEIALHCFLTSSFKIQLSQMRKIFMEHLNFKLFNLLLSVLKCSSKIHKQHDFFMHIEYILKKFKNSFSFILRTCSFHFVCVCKEEGGIKIKGGDGGKVKKKIFFSFLYFHEFFGGNNNHNFDLFFYTIIKFHFIFNQINIFFLFIMTSHGHIW